MFRTLECVYPAPLYPLPLLFYLCARPAAGEVNHPPGPLIRARWRVCVSTGYKYTEPVQKCKYSNMTLPALKHDIDICVCA